MARMIITVINEEEKTSRTGLSADAHLKTLTLKASNSAFEQEVARKLFRHYYFDRAGSKGGQGRWH